MLLVAQAVDTLVAEQVADTQVVDTLVAALAAALLVAVAYRQSVRSAGHPYFAAQQTS